MRIIPAEIIRTEIVRAIGTISFHADTKLLRILSEHQEDNSSSASQNILSMILKNNEIAAGDKIPICQDTGTTVAFVELGNEVLVQGATLQDILDQAVQQAQTEFYLRASMLSEPVFRRVNTGDNTPGIMHLRHVKGTRLKITIAQKGGGAENMSFMRMMDPATNSAQIVDFVVEGVLATGSKACPPLVIGIGIGGNFESCTILAKLAVFEDLGRINPEPEYADLEKSILERINRKGNGIQGQGGEITVVAVHIKHAPCHIASLPVAVNLQCHAHRHCCIEI